MHIYIYNSHIWNERAHILRGGGGGGGKVRKGLLTCCRDRCLNIFKELILFITFQQSKTPIPVNTQVFQSMLPDRISVIEPFTDHEFFPTTPQNIHTDISMTIIFSKETFKTF